MSKNLFVLHRLQFSKKNFISVCTNVLEYSMMLVEVAVSTEESVGIKYFARWKDGIFGRMDF